MTLTVEDEKLFEAVEGMDVIVIVNKTDLPQKIDMERVHDLAAHHKVITTAIIEEKGIDELEQAISDLFFTGTIEADDMTYVSNSRHIALLDQAYQAIRDVLEGIEIGTPIDIFKLI